MMKLTLETAKREWEVEMERAARGLPRPTLEAYLRRLWSAEDREAFAAWFMGQQEIDADLWRSVRETLRETHRAMAEDAR